MSTTARLDNPLINKMKIARLSERYGISFTELFERFSQLEIQPQEIDGGLYINDEQLRYLDNHHASLKSTAETFLYRCNETVDLWLVDTPLHLGGQHCELSADRKGVSGKLEFIASGLNEEILKFAHSLMLDLTDMMKGI